MLVGTNIAAVRGVTVSSLLLASLAEREIAAPSEEPAADQLREPEYIEEVIIEEVPVGTPIEEGEEVIIEEVPVEEEEDDDEETPRPPVQPTDPETIPPGGGTPSLMASRGREMFSRPAEGKLH